MKVKTLVLAVAVVVMAMAAARLAVAADAPQYGNVGDVSGPDAPCGPSDNWFHQHAGYWDACVYGRWYYG